MNTDFDKQEVSPAQAKATEAKTVKCRFCEGPHFFQSNVLIRILLPVMNPPKPKLNDSGSTASAATEDSTPVSAAGPSKYVPKFKRSTEEGGNGPQSRICYHSTSDDRDQGLAIRITNLSEIVVESDIRELVGAIGVPVARCNVGRDRNTGRCKGFAFVNFYTKEDAETVMKRLNGFPCTVI